MLRRNKKRSIAVPHYRFLSTDDTFECLFDDSQACLIVLAHRRCNDVYHATLVSGSRYVCMCTRNTFSTCEKHARKIYQEALEDGTLDVMLFMGGRVCMGGQI